ncbi:putative metal-binding motif-containing protein, partial [Flavobacterium dankookense]
MKQLLHNKVSMLLLFVMCFFVTGLWSQISISSGTTLSQNFDGIGSTTTASLPSNWKMSVAGTSSPTWSAGGNFTATTAQASSGSPSAGGRYNWGNGTTTTDRAVGFMTSGSYANPNSIMVHFQNTSGVQMNDVAFTFDYERYRVNSTACSITFFTSTDGSTWTARTAGDSGAFATGANAYNFTTGTVVSKSFALTGINIPNNGNLYLRWNFNSGSSNSQGVGLDNFTLTPTLAPVGPVVTTSAPTGLTSSSVTLNGTIDANGSSVDGSFDFGTSTSPYSNSYASTPGVITGTDATAVSATVSGLNPNVQYNFRAVGKVGSDVTNGSNVAFYTLANDPVIADEAVVVTSTSFDFNFNGSGNPFITEYAIKVGSSFLQSNGTLGATPFWRTELDWQIQPVPGLITVSGLTPNTTYLYAVKARNGAGVETAFGPDQTVTTLPNTSPSLEADPLTGFGSVCTGITTTAGSFGLLGEFLTGDVTVGPLDGFSFSTTEANPSYSSSLTLSPDANDEILEVIYVKFSPTLVQSYDGTILISGGGASNIIVAATGTGINNPVTAATVGSSSVTSTSATITGTITPGCSTVSSSGLEYSTSNDMSGSIQVSNPATLTGLEPNTQYFYRAYAIDGTGTVNGTVLNFTTSQLSAPVGLPASDITSTSFVANWEAVDGADAYRLDVSASPFTTVSSTPWINEFHYDDLGADGNEFVEIVVPSTYAGTGLTLTFYNGSGGGTYGTSYTLGSMVEGETNGNFTFYSVTTAADGVQNGAPDGFALSDSSGLISFLSYEGSFTATNGPASGQTSTAVSISETNSTPENSSIHLVGSGSSSSSFTWAASIGANTKGLTNSGQELISAGVYLVNDLDVAANLSHEVTGLNAQTTYYYRVRATSTNSTSANSNPITVITAAAPPTFGSVSQSVNIACDDSDATFFINGLIPNSTSSITYTIDNGDAVVITNVVANGSGSASVLIRLFLENDGQVLRITQIERTDAVTDALVLTENNTASISVSSNSNFYEDSDNDGYGNALVVISACEAPPGYVADNTDCDDANPGANPGLAEVPYDGVDNDCVGGLDNGFAPFTSTMLNCGTTLSNIGSVISCVGTANAVEYQFEITGPNGVQTINRNVQYFSLTQLANYQYATTYSVRVMLRRAGQTNFVGYYGPACSYSTPPVTSPVGGVGSTQLQSYCGETLPTLATLIATTSLPGVTQYRFRVTNTQTGTVQTLDRSLHWFSLTMLNEFHYGTTYLVDVAVRTTAPFPAEPTFGAPCTVT